MCAQDVWMGSREGGKEDNTTDDDKQVDKDNFKDEILVDPRSRGGARVQETASPINSKVDLWLGKAVTQVPV